MGRLWDVGAERALGEGTGSYAKDTYHEYSDIDLAVFWNKDEIDGFDETNPYIKEIIETGERII